MDKLDAQAEINRLNEECRYFEERQAKLVKQLQDYRQENLLLKEQRNKDHKYHATNIELVVLKHKLTLLLDGNAIVFNGIEDKTSRLIRIVCKAENLDRLKHAGMSVDEIYDLFYEEDMMDWFDADDEGRKKFKDNLYQWFRNINKKVSAVTRGEKLFIVENNSYRINPKLLFL